MIKKYILTCNYRKGSGPIYKSGTPVELTEAEFAFFKSKNKIQMDFVEAVVVESSDEDKTKVKEAPKKEATENK
jgi:hypothetical protein